MPVTLVDRLPLPNLKVYSAGSVLLLSVAVYYAVNVTSDPNWKGNFTVQRHEEQDSDAVVTMVVDPRANGTRNLTSHVEEVVTFMMQEPLCMWTLINAAYCSLALVGALVQRVVFGRLRVAEAQRVKDKFWNYVFYKFIFVFGVLNVQYVDEVLMWCTWFTLLGFMHLLGQLCKDRFDYLSSNPNVQRWEYSRVLSLLIGLLFMSSTMFGCALSWGLPFGKDTFAFMAAECVLVGVAVLHVMARFTLKWYDADPAGPAAYYTHLTFDALSLLTETAHVAHMVVYSNVVVSMASLVLLMQLRHLLHALLARLRRHRLYAALASHMSRNYPMASPEEVQKNEDNCAICWEPMKEARKLPCAHLFHNSCLCRWVQQDASCPTCRRALSAAPEPPRAPLAPLPDVRPNHLFHFDGSRYVSWLPSFSVEVTRVRDPPAPHLLDAMIEQVQQVFPQYPRALLAADLAASRSADLTVDNILEGRLPRARPPAAPAAAGTPEPAAAPRAAPPEPTPEERSEPQNLSFGTTFCFCTVDANVAAGRSAPRFPHSAAEREAMLRRRKQLLLDSARRRYLERMRARPAPAAPSAPAAPAAPAGGSPRLAAEPADAHVIGDGGTAPGAVAEDRVAVPGDADTADVHVDENNFATHDNIGTAAEAIRGTFESDFNSGNEYTSPCTVSTVSPTVTCNIVAGNTVTGPRNTFAGNTGSATGDTSTFKNTASTSNGNGTGLGASTINVLNGFASIGTDVSTPINFNTTLNNANTVIRATTSGVNIRNNNAGDTNNCDDNNLARNTRNVESVENAASNMTNVNQRNNIARNLAYIPIRNDIANIVVNYPGITSLPNNTSATRRSVFRRLFMRMTRPRPHGHITHEQTYSSNSSV
ncbi:E3 ubiquitin-protein ligase AMFR-like [Pararge aegeria]|nr:E3 ubiquitin-protein ligase AMFR-like [Pararge aegeria]